MTDKYSYVSQLYRGYSAEVEDRAKPTMNISLADNKKGRPSSADSRIHVETSQLFMANNKKQTASELETELWRMKGFFWVFFIVLEC